MNGVLWPFDLTIKRVLTRMPLCIISATLTLDELTTNPIPSPMGLCLAMQFKASGKKVSRKVLFLMLVYVGFFYT